MLGCNPGQSTPGLPTVAPPTPRATPRPTATPATTTSLDLPIGFPVDERLRPMQVIMTPQGKQVVEAATNGPTVVEVARDYQTRVQNDEASNRYGWNCRLHDYYEGAPGVDWYLPEGTPLIATMRGQAEFYIITTSNAFEYYGVDKAVTLGLPAPDMPLYPLPGPGGGMGIFVSILNGDLRAEYGHLELTKSLTVIPQGAYVPPYSPTFNYPSRFSRMAGHLDINLIARWNAQRGDVVGYVGNTGYSDVAHIHYQVISRDRLRKYCPTLEQLPNSGWLFGPSGRAR
jgi:hypothetical protein